MRSIIFLALKLPEFCKNEPSTPKLPLNVRNLSNNFEVRHEEVQKAMMSLDMTDSDGKDQPSFQASSTPADVLSKIEMEGEGETFSNPRASAWPVGFHAAALVTVPLPQCG